MKYHLAALLILSFCFLINRSTYIACCSITLHSKFFLVTTAVLCSMNLRCGQFKKSTNDLSEDGE